MNRFLHEIGTRDYAGVWLLLILTLAATLIWVTAHYREGGKWWLRTNVALLVFIVSPAVLVESSQVFGRLLDWVGIPGPLVWLFGLAAGELVTFGGYLLAGICILLGLGTVLNKRATQRARIASITASLVSCLFIGLYLYIASRPQHW